MLAQSLARNQWLVDILLARAQRTPYRHLPGYMDRNWLFNPYDEPTHTTLHPWLPYSGRFHLIHRPDSDRHKHDHPWDARTLVMRGWYDEEREDGKIYRRRAGDTATLKFGEYHRIVAVSPGGVLTLFITGPYQGTWGFLVDGKKVPWREYLGVKDAA